MLSTSKHRGGYRCAVFIKSREPEEEHPAEGMAWWQIFSEDDHDVAPSAAILSFVWDCLRFLAHSGNCTLSFARVIVR